MDVRTCMCVSVCARTLVCVCVLIPVRGRALKETGEQNNFHTCAHPCRCTPRRMSLPLMRDRHRTESCPTSTPHPLPPNQIREGHARDPVISTINADNDVRCLVRVRSLVGIDATFLVALAGDLFIGNYWVGDCRSVIYLLRGLIDLIIFLWIYLF